MFMAFLRFSLNSLMNMYNMQLQQGFFKEDDRLHKFFHQQTSATRMRCRPNWNNLAAYFEV